MPIYIEAEKVHSCYGRYIKDPRDDMLGNAKVVAKGGRMIVMAMTDLHEGDEIFIDYGVSYWADKADRLTTTQAEEVASQAELRGVQVGEVQPIVSSPMDQAEVEVQAPGVGKVIVSSRIEQLSDIERERYVVDNVEQSEDLAEELQYLVGHSFIDDENGHQYVVESILYDEDHKAVIAYRRAMDGASHALDNSPYLVYGNGGILQLCELWSVDSGQDGVRWPQGEAEWAQRQRRDSEGVRLLEVCEEIGQEYQVDRDTYMVQGEHRVVYRKAEMASRVRWRLWVPEVLRRLCMEIHHEGSAHPGSWRMLQTIKLRFYCPAMPQEVSQHCAECRGCALRSKYHRQPKIPIQTYPEARIPMERLHIDLTGELPATEGKGSKYTLVVKDYHTKYVWLFALRCKDAVSVAD